MPCGTDGPEEIKSIETWKEISAVKMVGVYSIRYGSWSKLGLRIKDVVEEMAAYHILSYLGLNRSLLSVNSSLNRRFVVFCRIIAYCIMWDWKGGTRTVPVVSWGEKES